jgi:hypothetical protein
MRTFGVLRVLAPVTVLAGIASLVACSDSKSGGFIEENGSDAGGGGGPVFGGGGGGDGGGFECKPNPNNYDIPGNNCDDDGDGKVDNPPSCDGALSISGDAVAFAKAIGICDEASKRGFGLVSASFTRRFGQNDPPKDEQHGILPKFGNVVKPREGASLGVLSTGYAREYDGTSGTAPFGGRTPNGKDWWTAINPFVGTGSVPPGYPRTAQGCPQLSSATNDVIDLRLELKAPPNAGGFKFDFNFYSSEWPAYICTTYNDAFIAYLTAKSFNGGHGDNISFDAKNNAVSVNNGFFDRCTPNTQTGCEGTNTATSVCPGGTDELQGTGFYNLGSYCGSQSTGGGATGWLTTQAPIQPGETFTLDLIIFDVGDGILDSSVLLDGFTWTTPVAAPSTERPPK